jgi:hypothetical protein
MTFGQMQALFWQRIDQAGSPDFNPTETDRLLNWGYDVWYIINRKDFDKDQAKSVNMTHLIRPFTFFNTKVITVVGTGADIVEYRDLAKMGAAFNKTNCYGLTETVFKNVVPVSISEVDVNRNDPFNKPTDDYPMYYQSHNGSYRIIQVECTTIPIFLNGNYFKILQAIDAQNTPAVEFEAQDYIARQVIDIAKILAKGDLDDYAAVKNAVQESSMTITN